MNNYEHDKNLITKFIQKYNLNGTIEGAQIRAEKDLLYTIFRNTEGNLRGEIVLNKSKIPEGIIGVYYTSKLLSMISILDNDISIEYKGENIEENSIKSVKSIDFKDSKGRKVSYAASTLDLIDYDGKKGLIKDYEIEIKLDNIVVQDLLKCFNAITTTSLTILRKNNKMYAVFNYSGANVNQIEIEIEAKVDNEFDNDDFISFPAGPIKEILVVNSKAFDKASMNVSIKGIMEFKFQEKDITSNYWLRKDN